MVIRRATKDDAIAIANLEKEAFSDPWPLKQIIYELEENPCSRVLLSLSEEGETVGYLDYMVTFDSSTINRLAVASSFRQQGVATALLIEMFEDLKKEEEPVSYSTLEVRLSNQKARKLYEKAGYHFVVMKKKYYDDGEDACYLVKEL